MRTSLIIMLLSLSCTCTAQDEVPVAPAKKWQFGLSTSGDFTSVIMYYENGLPVQFHTVFAEDAGIGWSAGFTSAFHFNNHWGLTGGLRFTEHNLTNGPITLFDRDGNNLGEILLVYHNRFIDVPFGIQYNTKRDRLLFLIANLSITPGYAMGTWNEAKADAKAESNGFKDGSSTEPIQNFNYFSLKSEAHAGIGMQQGQLEIQLLPQIRYNLFKATSENPINRRYYSTGLELRLLYTI